eukprot:CAMPEP_0172442412 /NCGR_PEP_ID=MMETSP1065-20121228/2842_1 /TAXON_ID=265537 /ORGANISM="Amphiprora paludosa, Strain CCMP125" /LENGTH=300 /DNA_ID=CAMNT_0013192253 /DNA_START=68 /DNA_END=970 /DNA_ORIENTATION=+
MTVVSSFTLGPNGVRQHHAVEDSSNAMNHPVRHHHARHHHHAIPLHGNKRKEISCAPSYDEQYHHAHAHHHQAAKAAHSSYFHATPFQPLVHHRNFPKNGVISPLSSNKQVHQQQEKEEEYPHHGYQIQVGSGPRLACDPPVLEIIVPNTAEPHCSDDDSNDENQSEDDSWIQGESGEDNDYEEQSFERMESWKSKYFVAQRDLHVERCKGQAMEDENKRLKRHLFELQRRLYESQRKRQRLANDMWNVPMPTSTNSNTRRVSSSSSEEGDAVKPKPTVSRAISSEESACRRAETTTANA